MEGLFDGGPSTDPTERCPATEGAVSAWTTRRTRERTWRAWSNYFVAMV